MWLSNLYVSSSPLRSRHDNRIRNARDLLGKCLWRTEEKSDTAERPFKLWCRYDIYEGDGGRNKDRVASKLLFGDKVPGKGGTNSKPERRESPWNIPWPAKHSVRQKQYAGSAEEQGRRRLNRLVRAQSHATLRRSLDFNLKVMGSHWLIFSKDVISTQQVLEHLLHTRPPVAASEQNRHRTHLSASIKIGKRGTLILG